jgi:hypothetical protein
MGLLNENSLYQTVDNVNESLFYHKLISEKEKVSVISWIKKQLGTKHAYANGFGVTDKDLKSEVRLFTGELLVSSASLRHVMTEEASRVLILLNKTVRKPIPELEKANKSLLTSIRHSEANGKPEGTYCCPTCTVALWRHMNVGGLGSYSRKLPGGLKILKAKRDKQGSWNGFRFYYTLLALHEMDSPEAKRELKYARNRCESVIKKIKQKDKFSKRRYDLLEKILN